jgi:hypothetical protein
VRAAWLAACSLVLAACVPAGGGTLHAHWATASDTADLTMPATATWCPAAGRLDIRASSGDTGVGLAIFPTDSGEGPGDYSIVEPGGPVHFRPSAAVALRWFGKVQVLGWWGDSGAVSVAGKPGGPLSGQGTGRMLSGLGPDSTVYLTLRFRGLEVRTDTLCDAPPPPLAQPTDSAAAPRAPPPPGLD